MPVRGAHTTTQFMYRILECAAEAGNTASLISRSVLLKQLNHRQQTQKSENVNHRPVLFALLKRRVKRNGRQTVELIKKQG